MRKAIGALDRPDLGTDLRNASLGQLARAVVECVDKLEGAELRRLQASPEDETVTQLVEALESLTWLTAQLNAGG
jgi:hypothetical protein